ncbi:MAG: fimbrillin family protein, partial [Bacteroidales bacterium]
GFKVFAVQHAVEATTDFSNSSIFMNQLKESWNTTLVPNAWSHTGNYYWPETEALSFFMVAPYYDATTPYGGDVNANLDITKGASMTLSVKIKDDVAEQIDVLAASVLNQQRKDQTTGAVNFTFKHILSRIGFKASMDKNDNLKFKVTGLTYSFADVKSKADFKFTDNTVDFTNSVKHATDYKTIALLTPDRILGGTVGGTKVENIVLNNDASYLMILPQDLAVAAIKVKVTYKIAVAGDAYGDSKTAEISLPAQKYVMGKAYTHNLKFSKSSTGGDDLLEVTFGEVTVEDWVSEKNPETGIDTEVPRPAQN